MDFSVIHDNLGYLLWGTWPDGPLGGAALTLAISLMAWPRRCSAPYSAWRWQCRAASPPGCWRRCWAFSAPFRSSC